MNRLLSEQCSEHLSKPCKLPLCCRPRAHYVKACTGLLAQTKKRSVQLNPDVSDLYAQADVHLFPATCTPVLLLLLPSLEQQGLCVSYSRTRGLYIITSSCQLR